MHIQVCGVQVEVCGVQVNVYVSGSGVCAGRSVCRAHLEICDVQVVVCAECRLSYFCECR